MGKFLIGACIYNLSYKLTTTPTDVWGIMLWILKISI